jgi:hypothetical protein
MGPDAERRNGIILGLVGAGEGILLGRGLELCFGIGQYLLIMLFGVLGGAGIALMAWLGRRLAAGSRKSAIRVSVAGAGAALVVFAAWFLWRILPLIKDEIRFSQ